MAGTTNTFLAEVVIVYDDLLSKTATNVFYINTKNDIETAINSLSINDEKKAEMLVTLNSNLAASTISKAMDQSIIICDKAGKIPLENSLLQKQIDSENKNIELKTAQIVSMGKEDAIKDAQNIKDLVIKTNQAADIAKATELKTAQIVSMGKEDAIKDAQNIKDLVIKTNQALKLDEDIDLITEQINEMKESVLDRQQKRPVEVANLIKQGTLIDGQIAKMTEDKLYVIAQKTSMIEQVSHNKIIKAMDSMADMIGTLGAGGLVPNSTMFGVYFRLNKLLTGEAEPTSYTVSKAT